MIKLRRLIQSFLQSLYPRVYFKIAPDTAQYPYLVFDFADIIDNGEGLKEVILEIDGWDDKNDTTALENLMASVNENLNKKTLTTENSAVVFYLENMLPVSDDDSRIRINRYTYQAKLFEC